MSPITLEKDNYEFKISNYGLNSHAKQQLAKCGEYDYTPTPKTQSVEEGFSQGVRGHKSGSVLVNFFLYVVNYCQRLCVRGGRGTAPQNSRLRCLRDWRLTAVVNDYRSISIMRPVPILEK